MSNTLALVSLSFALLANPARSSQEKPESPKAEEAVAKGLKSRVFEVKSRSPRDLRGMIALLGSGAFGAGMQANDELRTITVRDYPENLATIADALTRLDVPGPQVADVDLVIHVLEARRGEGIAGDLPDDLKETVAALRGTLVYKGYRLLTTFTQRVKDGARGVRGGGAVSGDGTTSKPQGPTQLDWSINQLSVAPAGSGPASVRLEGFKFEAGGGGKAEIQTDVTLKEGERVVVGTSVFRDRGLVLVVSAKRAR